MSDTIEVSRVLQFKGNVIHLWQQSQSVLKGKVREESVTGKAHFFERLGATAAVRRTTRHSDTPLVNSQHTRRMVTMVDYEWADLVDQQDKIRLLITPESEYAINAANAMKRAYDYEVILAMDADAKSGEDGSTTVAFTDEDLQDDDNSAAAVTTAQVAEYKVHLDRADIPADGRYFVGGNAFASQLLTASSAPLAASSDYNTVKALVKGELNTWLGFEWLFINSDEVIPHISGDSNDKYAYFFHRDAIGVAMGKDMMVKIDQRADKSYATQVYLCQTMGATRIQAGVARMRYNDNLS
jgi:hypothetical protein